MLSTVFLMSKILSRRFLVQNHLLHLVFSSFLLHLKMGSWCLFKLNSKWWGEKPPLVIDKRVIVLTGAPPFPFPLPWFTGNAEAENYTNRKPIYLFIYLFQRINKKKQECQGKSILIHVSEHNTVQNHIIELKNYYNFYLVLIFITDMNCVFHSRKWTW